MLDVKIKRVRHDAHPLPMYATKGSAAVDFYAHTADTVELQPGERLLVPLGVAMSIPEGFELRISPRSGLALKQGITLTNSPGLIDSDYRGEIGAIVHNLGDEVFIINDGMKICQGGFYAYEQARFEEVRNLDSTERGEGGYGSTGV